MTALRRLLFLWLVVGTTWACGHLVLNRTLGMRWGLGAPLLAEAAAVATLQTILLAAWWLTRRRAPVPLDGPPRVFLASGELSGDIAAALLAERLRARCPGVRLFGIGGARMRAAGVDVAVDTSRLGIVGISEVASVLLPVLRAMRAVRARVRDERPHVAVLVGNDVFHVLLGRALRLAGVPTVSLLPPQVWIWRSLARRIVPSFDLLLTCFPEEQSVYAAAGGNARFVGHYLAESLHPPGADEKAAARARLQLAEARRVICLLPGSRGHEVRQLGTVLLQAAAHLHAQDPGLRFVLPVADPRFLGGITREVERRGLVGHVRVVEGSHDALRAADLVIGSSGTASLEAALLGVPMVIAYRLAFVTYLVVLACLRTGLIRSDWVGLPNLVLGRMVLPEVKQQRLDGPEALVAEARRLLEDGPARDAAVRALAEIRAHLEVEDGFGRAADAVLALAAAGAAAPVEPVAPIAALAQVGE